MPKTLPIACSLDAAGLTERKAAMAELGRTALLRRTLQGVRAELEFLGSADDALRAIVEAERLCCPFLSLELRRRAGILALSIVGPPEATEVVAELVEAFGEAAATGAAQARGPSG